MRRTRRLARRSAFGRHPVRTGILVVLVALSPVWVSLGSALTDRSLGSSLAARGAEWVRSHGGASVVAWIENQWYSHHPPKVGGAPSRSAIPNFGASGSTSATVGSSTPPTAGTSTSHHRATTHPATTPPVATKPAAPAGLQALPTPASLVPFAHPALAGEGVWHPVGRRVNGIPAVYETFLRPDAVHTSYVVGLAWFDTKLLSARLYSGSYIPGGGPYTYTAPVSPAASHTLVAAFNAGFRMQDALGGYYTQHKLVIPLRTGGASFVIYKNGTANIGAWGTEVRMTPQVQSVRQNLVLLVDNGKPAPNLNANDTSVWGATLGNQVYVWRSGIGITKDGALVYVGGPGLNITDLANLLVRAGAIRAMELDINTDWVNLATFHPATPTGAATPANGTDLLPNMTEPPSVWFASWWTRDFFTMSAR
ncbi:MAG: phosphodiester glycosidase family protein [Actinomycetota bacterium]|nr:phosphodiester glycosidase family protein [Actinomycetota bacterium]